MARRANPLDGPIANRYAMQRLRMAAFGVGPPHPEVLKLSTGPALKNDSALPAEIWDLFVVAVLRKQHDRAFVTPLDVPLST
jgi:hypothetical protein